MKKKFLESAALFSASQIVPNLHQQKLNQQCFVGWMDALVALQIFDGRLLEFQHSASVDNQRVLEWIFGRRRFEHIEKLTDWYIDIDFSARLKWREIGCARFAFALEVVNGFESVLSVFQRLQQIHWVSGKENQLQLE